jgi:hypothetical protein
MEFDNYERSRKGEQLLIAKHHRPLDLMRTETKSFIANSHSLA